MNTKNAYDGDYVIAVVDRKDCKVCAYVKSIVFKNFANGDNLRIYHGTFDEAIVFHHSVNTGAVLTIANYEILKPRFDYILMTVKHARSIENKGKKK